MIALIIIGDPSSDGHGRSETYRIDHNLVTNSELYAAYRAGTQILGVDFAETCGLDYQDSSIQEETLEALIEHKILEPMPGKADHWQLVAPSKMGSDCAYEYEDEIHFNQELFAEVWLAIAKLGNPAFDYAVPKKARNEKVEIGGYGFFE